MPVAGVANPAAPRYRRGLKAVSARSGPRPYLHSGGRGPCRSATRRYDARATIVGMQDESSRSEAALDAAQQQSKASALALLEERLRAVAQQSVDDELEAVRTSGVWALDASIAFEVTVRRTDPLSTT